MKGNKRNGDWIQYDFKGIPLRKSVYDMGRMIQDELIVTSQENNQPNPIVGESKKLEKQKKKNRSKAKKVSSIFKLPKFGKD